MVCECSFVRLASGSIFFHFSFLYKKLSLAQTRRQSYKVMMLSWHLDCFSFRQGCCTASLPYGRTFLSVQTVQAMDLLTSKTLCQGLRIACIVLVLLSPSGLCQNQHVYFLLCGSIDKTFRSFTLSRASSFCTCSVHRIIKHRRKCKTLHRASLSLCVSAQVQCIIFHSNCSHFASVPS